MSDGEPEGSPEAALSRLDHLERIHLDGRDEIKRRIAQRDNFSTQLVLAITTSLAIAAAAGDKFVRILLVMPLAAGFFVMMILYSYRIHDRIVGYLRWELEPELALQSGTPIRIQWESYYGRREVPGLRRNFFAWVLRLSAILFPAFVLAAEWMSGRFGDFFFILSLGLAPVYGICAEWIVVHDKNLRKLAAPAIRRTSSRDRGTRGSQRTLATRVAVFIDRDGTIIEDTHYPHEPDKMAMLPGALAAMKRLAELDVHVNVVTNQAGVALGLFPVKSTRAMNRELAKRVRKVGGRIDAIYFCPDEEHEMRPDGRPLSPCSKPNPGMLHDAAADQDLDLGLSFLVGDKLSDVLAGQAAGCCTLLVMTGKAGTDMEHGSVTPDYQVTDLGAAVDKITSILCAR